MNLLFFYSKQKNSKMFIPGKGNYSFTVASSTARAASCTRAFKNFFNMLETLESLLGSLLANLWMFLGQMDQGLMKTDLWKSFVLMKPQMNMVAYFFIDLFSATLCGGAVFAKLLEDVGKECFIIKIWTNQGVRPQCRICSGIFPRGSTANRHFSQVHCKKAWTKYWLFFKFGLPVLIVMLITRKLLQYV